MPVVTGKSNIVRDYVSGDDAPDPRLERGRLYISTGTVANAATDSQNSKYRLASLPSDCILHPDTKFHVSSWGYADIRIGTLTDVAALASVLKSAGATVSPIVAGDVAKHGKELWQILGLAADPGGEIDIYAHGSVAAPVAAGTMLFSIVMIDR